jgi:Xaa-Pro aminopeptidase
MARITFIFLLFFTANNLSAQDPHPTGHLSNEFHKGRCDALRKIMPSNSMTVIFAYPKRVFSRDVNYRYHQNPDLYYFSGYKEPNSVLLIFKEEQQGRDGNYNEMFFVRKRNPAEEQWFGRRLGVEGVKNKLGFKQVYNDGEFASLPIDFSKFSKVLYDVLPDDKFIQLPGLTITRLLIQLLMIY